MTDRLSVIFYFMKLNRRFERRRILDNVGWQKKTKSYKYQKNKFTELEIPHCATLWLIDELKRREGTCYQKRLQALMSWKFSVHKNTPTNLLNRLLAIRYVSKARGEHDGRGNILDLTPMGKDFLNEMRDERKENVSSLLSLLGDSDGDGKIFDLNQDNYLKAFILFNRLSDRAWRRMLDEGREKGGCWS